MSQIDASIIDAVAYEDHPHEVRSYNRPQYQRDEFAQFAKEWGFQHTTSSPRYLQANGEVEQAIKTVKISQGRNKIQQKHCCYIEQPH